MDVRSRRIRRTAVALVLLLPLAVTACTTSTPAPQDATVSAPTISAAAMCGHTRPGPDEAPPAAVQVNAAIEGDLVAKTRNEPAGTTFWLAPGTHKLGDGPYDQIAPEDGDTFIGAPGAVLDGQRVNRYAFVGDGKEVTIRYLTVRGFVAPQDQGVVNHDSADGWVIEHNTITHNGGAGMMAGSRQKVRGNCLEDNGQYGMNAYKDGGISGLVLEDNEIVGNNTDDWESKVDGCGCAGGVKFWAVDSADVRGNWVHDNRGPGLWADTNNNDFLIEDNLIEENDGTALFYETSYNAIIRNNDIRRNNLVEGRAFADRGDSFPSAAIYLSESGGEPRVRARTDKIDIYGNVLINNWSGITLWENADRFCNSPANTSSGVCTLLVPEEQLCSPPGIASGSLYEDCRWKTKRVDIHDNRFILDPAAIGCRAMCGRMAVLSNYGTYPDWSPYDGDSVQNAITFDQGNRWHRNSYVGPWSFMPLDTDRTLNYAQWRTVPYEQDQDSTFERAGG